MPSDYTGSAFPTPGDNASPPAAGTPTAPLPAGADARNAASVRTPFESTLDYLAWIFGTSTMRPPRAPASTTSGFHTVTHTGGGSGTVTPSGAVGVAASYAFVVKIVLGGATGVATFQLSINGGKTYFPSGSTVTTAASYVDTAIGTGVTIEFSGTFQAGDTYSFEPAFTPIMAWSGSDTSTREFIDYLGYVGGRVSTFEENWDIAFTVAAAQARAQNTTVRRWNHTTTANAAIAREAPSAGFLYHPVVKLTPGTANTNECQLDSEILFNASVAGGKLEFEFAMSAVGANDITWQLGFSDQTDNTPSALFIKESSDTNWLVQTTDGSAGATSTRTDLAPVVDTFDRFRIDVGPSAVKYFINEQLVAVHVPASPMAQLACYFKGHCTGAASSFGRLSPLRVKWLRNGTTALGTIGL